MAERYLGIFSTSLSIKEMEIKMTLRYTILHLSEWLGSKTLITAYAGEDVEKEEHSFIAGGNTNLYNHFENQYCGFSENWESIYLKTQHYHYWAHTYPIRAFIQIWS